MQIDPLLFFECFEFASNLRFWITCVKYHRCINLMWSWFCGNANNSCENNICLVCGSDNIDLIAFNWNILKYFSHMMWFFIDLVSMESGFIWGAHFDDCAFPSLISRPLSTFTIFDLDFLILRMCGVYVYVRCYSFWECSHAWILSYYRCFRAYQNFYFVYFPMLIRETFVRIFLGSHVFPVLILFVSWM